MQPGIISQARSPPGRFQVRQNVLFVSRPWRTFFSGAGTNPTEAPPQGNDLPPRLPGRIFGGKGESPVKTIAALTQIPGKPRRMRVEFRNGEPVELAMDIIARHRLLVGHAVSAETLRAAQEEDARKEAETAALKLLNRKNCSEQELRRTLRANGFGERLVDDVVDKCRGWGYLDDRHLAEMVVTDAIERRHLGPARIRETLRKRGLDTPAQQPSGGESSLVDQALAALKGKERTYARLDRETARRRMIAFLQRRGFSFDTIRAALARLGEDSGGEG